MKGSELVESLNKNVDYKTPRWAVSNECIMLKTANGELKSVSALEIFGAEFQGKTQVSGTTIERLPSEDLPDIKINRFPLEAFLCVCHKVVSPGASTSWWIELVIDDQCFQLANLPACKDQIIVKGHWYPLIPGHLEEIERILHSESATSQNTITLRQYLNIAKNISDRTKVSTNNIFTSLDNVVAETENHPKFEGKLRPYQEIGTNWLSMLADQDIGCILADEMGLGKTVQVIAFLAKENFCMRSPSLVIATGTLLDNWERELAKFAPSLRVLVHRGRNRTGFPNELGNHDITVTSYDTAVRDFSLLKMISWNSVILDEAQAIKNPDTQRATYIKQIPRRIGIAVTGTPYENHLRDIWSIMNFSCEDLLGPLPSFEDRFKEDFSGAAALEPIISPLILRRPLDEVVNDLPKRIDITQPLEMSHESVNQYNDLRKQLFDEYGRSAPLTSLIKLRMFCAHPLLLESENDDPLCHSLKYSRLTEILEEILLCRRKVLIFTSFSKMIDILKSDLSNRFQKQCKYIDGRTPVEKRQSIVDQFEEDQDGAILILNPKAAGTGLNITAANHVIHYNLEWNPATEDQATARAHRLGQTRPVTVHRFFYLGTVEEVIDDRLTRKRELAETVLVGTEGREEDLADITRALLISPQLDGVSNE